MPNKSETGLTGLLNKKYSKLAENLIANYGDIDDGEKINAAIADDDGRSILTQHIVRVSNVKSNGKSEVLLYGAIALK